MRGEKYGDVEPVDIVTGSPPHARGKVYDAFRSRHKSGITPACAGKSAFCSWFWSLPWDHPRMRGEKTKKDPKL